MSAVSTMASCNQASSRSARGRRTSGSCTKLSLQRAHNQPSTHPSMQRHLSSSSLTCRCRCLGGGGTPRRRQHRRAAPVACSAAGDAHATAVPAWRQVVGISAGALLLCNLHRSAFAVLLPDLQQQLQLSNSQAGAVQAAMLIAYGAGQVGGVGLEAGKRLTGSCSHAARQVQPARWQLRHAGSRCCTRAFALLRRCRPAGLPTGSQGRRCCWLASASGRLRRRSQQRQAWASAAAAARRGGRWQSSLRRAASWAPRQPAPCRA